MMICAAHSTCEDIKRDRDEADRQNFFFFRAHKSNGTFMCLEEVFLRILN